MNKLIINSKIYFVFVLGIFIASCQSPAEKVDEAKNNVSDAKQDLREAQTEAKSEVIKIADELEWKTFKEETEIKIRNNEVAIKDIKRKMTNKDNSMDVIYSSQIDLMEQQNKRLRERMDNYQKSQSDWVSFKNEFNHDMDELGKALKDFVVTNKK